MANLINHKVVAVYKTTLDPDHLYHVTKNDRVVRTGLYRGNAKILHVVERDGKMLFNFKGLGRRATAAEFRQRLDEMVKI